MNTAYQSLCARLMMAGVPDARFDAVQLYKFVTGRDPRLDNGPTPDEASSLRVLGERRAAREPLQYLLGEWAFMGLPIRVRPGVLILDEPTAGLDPAGCQRILETICDYREKTGSTVVIVSHSMEDMAQYCDDVIVLANAKVILQGDRETVYAHGDLLEKTGLDVPQITRLIGMLRKRGFDLPANIYTVDRAYDVLRERLCGR